MQRVLILGSSGAGKSTLARALAAQTGLPVVHLDQLYWGAGWVETDDAVWQGRLRAALDQPRWIMDGNYASTLEARLRRADTAILLAFPRRLCLWRVFLRLALHCGRTRPDLCPGCPERLDIAFLRYVWNFPRTQMPTVETALNGFCGTTIILKTPREAKTFLKELQAAPFHKRAGLAP